MSLQEMNLILLLLFLPQAMGGKGSAANAIEDTPAGKAFCRRKVDSEDDDEDAQVTKEVWLKLEEAKEVQCLRGRPNGVSAAAVLMGEKLQEETTLVDDPFKIKTGGKVDMKKLKERGRARISEEEDLNLGTSFAAETNRRDEDADMMKYIETELKRRKGIVENEEQKVKQKNPEDCLYELPENIRVSSAKKTEEMLSSQMLSSIPEVDLGIEAKIKNIISTEEANARLLAEQQNKKKDSRTSFVPMNMAVNYVQHNRFYHEKLNAPVWRNKEEPKAHPLRVGDTEKPEPERFPPNCKHPPDEKFKKMNRRY
ncbi:splicing factor C9orf78 homolog [Podarcis raffonei]|uniref:splicing factor C9orf78 homolog n=1 Tax=Podarcis raffonei TaxID=65483 RepID=UPI0023290A09|nr:splicing factor C9orf78 homolog [Podarcis raffonei]